VAVDWTARPTAFEHGIPEQEIRVLLNAVDLDGFLAARLPPPRPRRALV